MHLTGKEEREICFRRISYVCESKAPDVLAEAVKEIAALRGKIYLAAASGKKTSQPTQAPDNAHARATSQLRPLTFVLMPRRTPEGNKLSAPAFGFFPGGAG
jgi:hypothetical protein